MMYKQMNSAKLQSAATGAVGFTPQGDPDMTKIEISNWVGGKFKNVGSWVQAEADYAKCVQAAATGKQCGVLQIRQDDVTWMGGMQGGSPPDRANHLNHVHAEYMTLVAWLLIVSIVGGNLLELIHFLLPPAPDLHPFPSPTGMRNGLTPSSLRSDARAWLLSE